MLMAVMMLLACVIALTGCSSKKKKSESEMYDTSKLMPIGSVVQVSGLGTMVITGVAQVDGYNVLYDYSGCTYPQGCTGTNNYMFNRGGIMKVLHKGYDTKEEQQYLNSQESQMNAAKSNGQVRVSN